MCHGIAVIHIDQVIKQLRDEVSKDRAKAKATAWSTTIASTKAVAMAKTMAVIVATARAMVMASATDMAKAIMVVTIRWGIAYCTNRRL